MFSVIEIEILGEKYPVRYDVNALGEFELITGENTLDGSIKQFNIRMLHALAYVGLKHGHLYQNKTPFTKSHAELGAWIPTKSLGLFIPIFQKFNGDDQPVKAGESQESPGE
jgi:hypothetical protein